MTITIVEPNHAHVVTIIGDDASVEAPEAVSVTQTIEGEAGASAYRVAILNGFSGSQTQWLASLKGQPGDSVVSDPGDFTLIFNNGLV